MLLLAGKTKLGLPALRIKFQLQFLQEHGMVKRPAFAGAVQQAVAAEDFDALGLALLPAVPFVNRLEEFERLAGGPFGDLPCRPRLLPFLRERGPACDFVEKTRSASRRFYREKVWDGWTATAPSISCQASA